MTQSEGTLAVVQLQAVGSRRSQCFDMHCNVPLSIMDENAFRV